MVNHHQVVLLRQLSRGDVGEILKGNPVIKLLTPHISRHMGRIFSGAASTSNYSLGLLRFGMKNGLRGEDPREMAVR